LNPFIYTIYYLLKPWFSSYPS